MEIINAKIIGYPNLQRIIINENGIIQEIIPQDSSKFTLESQQVLNVKGDWISLGGIDLQINGGLGLAFPDLEEKHLDKIDAISQYLWQQGVDGFCPTIVTTSKEKINRSLSVISLAIAHQNNQSSLQKNRAKIIGVHLEGPFLNYEKRGAHPAEYLLPPTVENAKEILGDYSQIVTIMTMASELDKTGELIPYLKSLGITISLGHSLATAEEAKIAFEKGASMVTHAFNAMPSLHHRKPGLLGEAIVNENVYCGLIADGQHVYPTTMKLLLKASDYHKGIFLVSDALSPIGLPDGIYPWDDRQIEVKNGTARLKDDTLAGTTLPLLVGVENLVKWGICDVETAILLATESPRMAIGMSGFSLGQKANLLRWHWHQEKNQLSWKRIIAMDK